jgi:hypothetical protein
MVFHVDITAIPNSECSPRYKSLEVLVEYLLAIFSWFGSSVDCVENGSI